VIGGVPPETQSMTLSRGETASMDFPLQKIPNIPVERWNVSQPQYYRDYRVFYEVHSLTRHLYGSWHECGFRHVCRRADTSGSSNLHCTPQPFTVMSRRQYLVDITPGDEFQMNGEGAITKNCGNNIVRGSNLKKVITTLVTTEEETDGILKLTGEKAVSQLNPSSTFFFICSFLPLSVRGLIACAPKETKEQNILCYYPGQRSIPVRYNRILISLNISPGVSSCVPFTFKITNESLANTR